MDYKMESIDIPIFLRLGFKQNEWAKIDSSQSIKLSPSGGIGCQLMLMNKLLTNILLPEPG